MGGREIRGDARVANVADTDDARRGPDDIHHEKYAMNKPILFEWGQMRLPEVVDT